MKNLKIQLQTTLIAIIALMGFGIVAAIYMVNTTIQHEVHDVQVHETTGVGYVNAIKTGFLQERRNEKDFRIRKDMKYADRHAATAEELKPYFAKLKTIHQEPDEQKLISEMEAGFDAYVVQFRKLVTLWQEIGLTPEEGLRGTLRKAVHDVETKLKEFDDPRLMVTMLMMRRHEKDFLMRLDEKYVKRMDMRLAEFTEQLSQSTIPADVQTSILGLMQTYHTQFKALSAQMLQTGPVAKQLSALFSEVQPKLDFLDEKGSTDAMAADEALADNMDSTFMTVIVTMLVIAAIAFVLALIIGRGISGPIGRMTEAMRKLADGNLETEVPGQDMTNEIGQMADTVQVFKENAIEVKRLEAEQKANEERQAQERRQLMLNMADEFESSVGSVVQSVSSASTEMQSSATALSATAEETSKQATTVAAASEQAATNVQTVASASEELSSSISEISRQVAQSTQISATAVAEVEGANKQVQGLAESSQKIGEVVALITDIADQTNLLALNATIEAARAGDAGKGFAVVASEVKNLANQTAKATEEISNQISGIQGATEGAVHAIGSIGGIINQMNEIASTIASAVEEQGAATQEIARNVEQASEGTQEVSANISGVQHASGETGQSASQMLEAASELSQQSETLRAEVDKFLANIRNG